MFKGEGVGWTRYLLQINGVGSLDHLLHVNDAPFDPGNHVFWQMFENGRQNNDGFDEELPELGDSYPDPSVELIERPQLPLIPRPCDVQSVTEDTGDKE